MIKIIRLTLLFFLILNGAFANDAALKFLQKSIKNPKLIGQTNLRFWGLKIYHIALFGQKKQFSYDQKFAINIKYNMAFDKEELVERSILEIKRTYQISDIEEKNITKKLNEIFVNVKKGDEKTAFFDPNKGVLLYFNAKLVGKITNLDLARKFIDIWLSNKSSYPDISREIKNNS